MLHTSLNKPFKVKIRALINGHAGHIYTVTPIETNVGNLKPIWYKVKRGKYIGTTTASHLQNMLNSGEYIIV